jgi:hypothetical protein
MSAVRALGIVRAGPAERALAIDSGWSLATALLPAGASLPAAMILAHSLSTADYGLFNFFGQGTTAAVAVLAGASGFALSYHFNATKEDRLTITLAVAAAYVAGTAVLTCALLALGLLTAGAALPVAVIGCLMLPSAAMQSFGAQLLRARLRFEWRTFIELIRTTLWLTGLASAALVGALTLNSAMALRIVALVSSAVAVLFIFTRPSLAAFEAAFARVPAMLSLVWARTKYALGMSTANLIASFALLGSVGLLDGSERLGVLGYGWIIALPFTMSMEAVGGVLLPHVAGNGGRFPVRARTMARVLVAAELPLLAILLVAMGPTVGLAAGVDLAGPDLLLLRLFVIGQYAKLLAAVDLSLLNARGHVQASFGTAAVTLIVFLGGIAAAALTKSGALVIVGAFAVSQLVAVAVAAKLWSQEVEPVP